jgi:hypothetical protein
MARFSAMFLPERSGFGLNELLGSRSLIPVRLWGGNSVLTCTRCTDCTDSFRGHAGLYVFQDALIVCADSP